MPWSSPFLLGGRRGGMGAQSPRKLWKNEWLRCGFLYLSTCTKSLKRVKGTRSNSGSAQESSLLERVWSKYKCKKEQVISKKLIKLILLVINLSNRLPTQNQQFKSEAFNTWEIVVLSLNIIPESHIKVMRMNKMITHWSSGLSNKFSLTAPQKMFREQ